MKSKMIQKIGNGKSGINIKESKRLTRREFFILSLKHAIRETRGYRVVILGSLYGLKKGIEIEIPKSGYNSNVHKKVLKLERRGFNGMARFYDPVTFEPLR